MPPAGRTYLGLDRMEPISLEEMDSVKLMNRVDTKYVANEEDLDSLLLMAAEKGFRACLIEGRKITPYWSMYYDTDDLEMFRIHRAGHSVRQKIRVRTYECTGNTFLEIKRKNNKGRTKKKRIPLPDPSAINSEEASRFIADQSWYSRDRVSEACTTSFHRITLVNSQKTERITLDTCLSFSNPRTGLNAGIPGAVIIELKQDGRLPSEMKEILLSLRIHPFKVSKYCIGTVLTTPTIFKGRFKEKVRRIDKIRNRNNNNTDI